MTPFKQPQIIKGQIHWKCPGCKMVKHVKEYYDYKTIPTACKKCIKNRRDKHTQKLKENLCEDEWLKNDKELLKSLQAFDPSWTMEKLNKARADPI